MMIFRRIWHLKNPWTSGSRCPLLLQSYATQTKPSTAVPHSRNPPFLWVSSRALVSKYATTSSPSANKLNYLSISYGTKGCLFSSHALTDPTTEGIVDVPLAQTGEGIAECELLKWFVQEGDQVEEFQQLCEVQSDKATIEITSRYKGKVSQILHNQGDIVKVGETLLKMLVGESSVAAQTSDALGKLNSVGSDTSDLKEESSVLKKADGGGVLSTPAVRGLAKQHGINLNDICGTGENGRVLKEDVLNYAAQKGPIKANTASLGATSEEEFLGSKSICTDAPAAYEWDFEDKTVKLRGYQRAMVKSMTMAAKIPHFHFVEDINCTALVKLKSSFQQENSDPNVKHTFLPVLIKSLSMALCKYPMLNSCFNEELYEVTLRGWHNIGIAMATPSGLVVPNIKKVQSLSILEITKELSRLQQLALANKLNPDDVSGGTITLSNIGAIGGKFGSPLVNVPEVSIIALGRIQKLPHFADDGTVYPVSVMSVNIGSDHRVLDGATVAKFCTEWKQYIEKPELLLLHTR